MNEDELKAVEDRASAATAGPWVSPWDKPNEPKDCFGITSSDHFTSAPGEDVVSVIWYDGPHLGCTEPDAAFIVAARSDVPALCAAVRKRDATIATLRQLIEGTVTALSLSDDPQMTIVSELLTLALSVPS